MKLLSTSAALCLVFCMALVAGPAGAGSFGAVIVTIDREHSVAGGSLTGARINPGTEFIQCDVSIQGAARNIRNSGGCRVRTAAGLTASCRTTEPALLLAIQSITAASDVRFGWDATNTCTFIAVRHASLNLE